MSFDETSTIKNKAVGIAKKCAKNLPKAFALTKNKVTESALYKRAATSINNYKKCDLPLDKGDDSNFLILIIALMSFLAVLSLSGTIALTSMTERWSSGLENKVTIEVAVETKEGHILSQETIGKETLALYKMLSEHKNVKTADVLEHEDIRELISPWIGDNLSLEDIPLPGLIAVELRGINAQGLDDFKNDILKTSHYANLETHHEWLSDLINFTHALKTLALLITIIISAITIIAIAYAMRTRLALHKNEVVLLHHMGARDHYIARQFQYHAMVLSLRGGVFGTAAGLTATFLLTFLSHNSGTDLIPVISIGLWGILTLCLIPVIVSLVAVITSHITVLRCLGKMP